MLGLGTMIRTLNGNEETVDAIKNSLNKVIKQVKIEDNTLEFEFEDGTKLNLADCAQSCCECRYMSTDDDLVQFAGSILQDFELKDGVFIESESDEYGEGVEHDIQFLEVVTDKGTFKIVNHNEHNGWYGGFSIEVERDYKF